MSSRRIRICNIKSFVIFGETSSLLSLRCSSLVPNSNVEKVFFKFSNNFQIPHISNPQRIHRSPTTFVSRITKDVQYCAREIPPVPFRLD